jgi:hypothetical protein
VLAQLILTNRVRADPQDHILWRSHISVPPQAHWSVPEESGQAMHARGADGRPREEALRIVPGRVLALPRPGQCWHHWVSGSCTPIRSCCQCPLFHGALILWYDDAAMLCGRSSDARSTRCGKRTGSLQSWPPHNRAHRGPSQRRQLQWWRRWRSVAGRCQHRSAD